MHELYQAEWCPFSHVVRQRMTELELPFVAHQVPPQHDDRTAMEAAVGSRVIPVLKLEDGTLLDGDAEEIVAELTARFPANDRTPEHHERRFEARSFEP